MNVHVSKFNIKGTISGVAVSETIRQSVKIIVRSHALGALLNIELQRVINEDT